MEKFDVILTIRYFRTDLFGGFQPCEDSVCNPDKKQLLKAFKEFKKSSVNVIDYCTGNVHYFADYGNYSEYENGIATLTIHTYANIVENNLSTMEKMSVEKVKAVFVKAVAENMKDENEAA